MATIDPGKLPLKDYGDDHQVIVIQSKTLKSRLQRKKSNETF
jgi:hypothetical protein